MAAGLVTPTEAGQGPSVLGIAMSIGAKIRDAAQDAKEEREKAAEKGQTPKKGSLFKSALSNQFNPIKSKKAKSNWAKQFDWNKKTDKAQEVKEPTSTSGEGGKAKLKEFIAGGFTAILQDTSAMISRLDGVKLLAGENLSEVTRATGSLSLIKESVDAQTDLRRKALEDAKYARSERRMERTKDVAGLVDNKKSDPGGSDGKKSDNPLSWLLENPMEALLTALGLADVASNFAPFLKNLKPFGGNPRVTSGQGGSVKPGGARVTTSGGQTVPKAKGAKIPGVKAGLLSALFAAFEFKGRKDEGQSNLQAGIGTAGSAAGGLVGWKAGAAAGAAIGTLFGPGPGTLIGGAIGGILGSIGGSMAGGALADKATGVGQTSSSGDATNFKPPTLNQFSEGGIIPLAKGGLVDNPTKTTLYPGDKVIPLNRNVGKEMLNSDVGETPLDASAAMLLGISAGMLGKTDSGTAGDAVKQRIRQASKQYGISNLTFTSSLGKGKFGEVDTKKDSKDFMTSMLKHFSLFGGGAGTDGGDDSGGGGGGNNNTPNADLAGTSVVNEVDLAANTHRDVGFTSGFGRRNTGIPGASTMHRGQDIGTRGQKGYYVAMKKSGKVVHNKTLDGAAGNWVGIDVGNGVEYRFMHLAQPSHLKPGTPYNGETIGEIGNTGVSSGEHLHFEKLVNGVHVDPKEDASALLDIGKGTQMKPAANPPQIATEKSASDPGTEKNKMPGPTSVKKEAEGGGWWPFGKKASGDTVKALQNKARQGNMGLVPQKLMNRNDALEEAMRKARGYQGGGTGRTTTQEYQRRARVASQSQSMEALNSGRGVEIRGSGMGTLIGKGYPAVYKGREAIKVKLPPGGTWEPEVTYGGKRWYGVKQGDHVIYVSQFKAGQKNLGVKTKETRPSAPPAPPRAPSQAPSTRPSTPAQSSTPIVAMPPISPSKPSTSQSSGSFGSQIPAAKTSAMVFADFLYPDLV